MENMKFIRLQADKSEYGEARNGKWKMNVIVQFCEKSWTTL
jgi:hypothetical protein